MKSLIVVILALVTPNAFASVKVFNSSDVDLGHFAEIKCGGNLDCTAVSGQGLINLVGSPDGLLQNQSSTSGDITVSQCGGTFVSDATEDFWVLPDISGDSALGCRLTFVVGIDSTLVGLKISPATESEQILILTNAAGDDVSADAAGESVVLEAVTSGANPLWAPVGKEQGSWVDIN